MKFSELNIIEPIMRALTEKGYTEPTPIQVKAIPLILNKEDILGVAQTGTGKTAAFAIPIIQLIEGLEGEDKKSTKIRALIVTPTRELAIQIDDNIKGYSKHTKIKHAVIFGGVKQGTQVDRIRRGVHILTATPGRLLDLIDQGFVSLEGIKMFVLDEADRMLDMGFINDIKKLLKIIPEKRQSLFFSATMPDNIVKLSNNILRNPKKIEVTPVSSTAETIQQFVYYTNRTSKPDLLIHVLEERKIDQVLIFTRTKHGADRVSRNLVKQGVSATSIHGDKAQNQRQKALQMFKDGQIRVLVATDIAARGIDIDKLKFVINYEVPNMPETYVHRIGRSGRAGEEGIAITLCEAEENADVKEIQKLIGDKIVIAQNDNFPQTDSPMSAEEKKEWEKEKQKKKQEFFATRKSTKSNGRKSSDESRSQKPKGHKEKNKRKEGDSKQDVQKNNSKTDNRLVQTDRRELPKNEKQGDKTIKNTDSPIKNNDRPARSNDRPARNKDSSQKSWKGSRNTNASDKLKSKYKWPLE